MCFLNYVKAGYPIMWVKTHEETRALSDYTAQISQLNAGIYTAHAWDVADGVGAMAIKNGAMSYGTPVENTASDPMAPLLWLDEKAGDNTILFLKDYHPFLQASFQDSVLLIRKIRNLISKFKSQGKVLVIVSPEIKIPMELDKEINVLEYKLPNREILRQVLHGLCEATGAKVPKDDEAILDASLGMTSFEAENAFSVSLIESKEFNAKSIRREKAAIVKKTGLLEVVESNYTMDDIGGLENLKGWLTARKDCFTPEAKKFGIMPPKGLLMVGVPGGGKSLSAKAVASAWGRPLLRLDMGRVFGSYVGESESNMKRVLDIADAVSPCILWVDELEKSLSGNKAGMESHETSKRVFQQLLTWMQEKTADVFLVATANSVSSLPPELLRAGRIDAIFWVDLPDAVQREEIFKIHLKKAGRNPELFGKGLGVLIKACDGFTGAEIEVWIKEALVRAYSQGHKELQAEDLLDTMTDITPISKLMKDDIDGARKWALGRGCKMASPTHEVEGATTTKPRKIQS